MERELLIQGSSLAAAVLFLAVCMLWLTWSKAPPQDQLDSPDLPAYPSPARGMATIYVVRPSHLAMMVRFSVRLDEPTAAGEVGKIGARRYLAISVPPGRHRLYCATLGNQAEQSFEIAEGQSLAFLSRAGIGVLWWIAGLAPMDDRTARFYLTHLKKG